MRKRMHPFNLSRRSACLLAALWVLTPVTAQSQTRASLAVGEALEEGATELRSPNGRFRLIFTPGSGLQLWDQQARKQLWEYRHDPFLKLPGTPGLKPPHRMVLEAKGSLVLRASDGTSIVWSSQSDYAGVRSLVLDDNGDLTIQDGAGQKIWSLRDPATQRYRNDDNGVFLKYSGTGPDPSRYSSTYVDLDALK
jgi:hypothetical protein